MSTVAPPPIPSLRKSAPQTNKTLEDVLAQQKLLSQVAYALTSTGNFADIIHDVLKTLGTYTDTDRVYIFEDNETRTLTSNTYEWCAEGVLPQKDDLQNFPYDIIPSFKRMLDEEGQLVANDIAELPKDTYEVLKKQEIKSILAIPIRTGKNGYGFAGFDITTKIKQWDDVDILFLKTIAGLLSNFFRMHESHEKLETQEEYFRIAVDSTGIGVWTWDMETSTAEISERWADMIGYTKEELEPMTREKWRELCHPDDRQHVEEALEAHLQGKVPTFTCEGRVQHKNGNWVWILDQGQVFKRNPEGKPTHMAGTRINITDRKKKEQELRIALRDVEKVNQFMNKRELRMVELKDKLKELAGNEE